MRTTTARRVAAVAVLCLIAVGAGVAGALVGRDDSDDKSVPEAGARGGGERRASFLAQLIPLPPERGTRGGKAPRSIGELARRLPLERKVAQLLLVGFNGRDLNDPVFRRMRRLDLGGVVIDRRNYTGVELLPQLAGEAGVIAREERHVPPFVMAPQEGGDFNAFPDLPPATAATDLESVSQARAETRQAAGTLRPLGINGVLAPVVDVGLADDPALGPRAYSDDPAEVAAYARAVVETYRRGQVFSAAEHFPGLGSASQSTEDGPANVGLSEDELRERDLVPFRAAVQAGVPGIVVGHGLYTTDSFVTPASQSSAVIGGLLREDLRFKGIAIADDISDPAVTALGTIPDAAVESIKAGADMVYISRPPGAQQAAYVALLRAARKREIPRKRLDQAVTRILSGKRDYGLVE
jgi:beta-N-acetylhexosaminidase